MYMHVFIPTVWWAYHIPHYISSLIEPIWPLLTCTSVYLYTIINLEYLDYIFYSHNSLSIKWNILQVIVQGLRESNIFSDLLQKSSSSKVPPTASISQHSPEKIKALVSSTNSKVNLDNESSIIRKLLSLDEEPELELAVPPLAAPSLEQLMEWF